ncbi:hypothetical protein SAMN05216436_105143 [bacterium A37T11]|nr:hypothetical protein SAMN05216436_105143 [bacterium A37T11]
MKHIITLIGLLLTMSCSVFKHKIENNSSRTHLTVHSVQRKDSLQITAQTQHIRYLSDDQLEITEIVPEGTFSYHPDSGFQGEAFSVHIYRQHQQRTIDRDTTTLSNTGTRLKSKVDSTVQTETHHQLEETKKSKPISIWGYLGVAVMLGLIYFYFYGLKKGS